VRSGRQVQADGWQTAAHCGGQAEWFSTEDGCRSALGVTALCLLHENSRPFFNSSEPRVFKFRVELGVSGPLCRCEDIQEAVRKIRCFDRISKWRI
jgi:hypothetical protein